MSRTYNYHDAFIGLMVEFFGKRMEMAPDDNPSREQWLSLLKLIQLRLDFYRWREFRKRMEMIGADASQQAVLFQSPLMNVLRYAVLYNQTIKQQVGEPKENELKMFQRDFPRAPFPEANGAGILQKLSDFLLSKPPDDSLSRIIRTINKSQLTRYPLNLSDVLQQYGGFVEFLGERVEVTPPLRALFNEDVLGEGQQVVFFLNNSQMLLRMVYQYFFLHEMWISVNSHRFTSDDSQGRDKKTNFLYTLLVKANWLLMRFLFTLEWTDIPESREKNLVYFLEQVIRVILLLDLQYGFRVFSTETGQTVHEVIMKDDMYKSIEQAIGVWSMDDQGTTVNFTMDKMFPSDDQEAYILEPGVLLSGAPFITQKRRNKGILSDERNRNTQTLLRYRVTTPKK